MTEQDAAYAVSFAIPLDTPGVVVVMGRQINDARRLEGGDIDGVPYMAHHEGLIIFDNVFVPWDRVFLYNWRWTGPLVEIFAGYHRQGYGGCKSGLGNVIIGAAYELAKSIGVENRPQVAEKLAEMVFLNESMYSAGLAASWEASKLLDEGGGWWVNPMYANVTKHLVTRFPYEIARLAHDIAGGLVGTAPSEFDFKNEEIRSLLEKYLQGVPEIPAEERLRLLRLLENVSVGFLIESVHGAGSPAAQKIVFNRLYDYEKAGR